MNLDKIFTESVYNDICYLLKTIQFKEAMKYGPEFHITDGFKYFVKEISRFNPNNKINITFQDILHCRRKTIGIYTIYNKKKDIEIIEFSKQRNQLKVI
jgi:hypothetical protein